MQNENIENQKNQIKQNPSRNNTNVQQGQSNEKRFNEESNVESSGVSGASSDQTDQFGSGEATLEKGFSGKEAQQVPTGSPNSGSQIEQQQAGAGTVKGDAKDAGAGAGYESQLGTGGQGQQLMGEDSDKNEKSGTAPGSGMGDLKKNQFNQEDSQRQ